MQVSLGGLFAILICLACVQRARCSLRMRRFQSRSRSQPLPKSLLFVTIPPQPKGPTQSHPWLKRPNYIVSRLNNNVASPKTHYIDASYSKKYKPRWETHQFEYHGAVVDGCSLTFGPTDKWEKLGLFITNCLERRRVSISPTWQAHPQ
jgi:hypothetical protein